MRRTFIAKVHAHRWHIVFPIATNQGVVDTSINNQPNAVELDFSYDKNAPNFFVRF